MHTNCSHSKTSVSQIGNGLSTWWMHGYTWMPADLCTISIVHRSFDILIRFSLIWLYSPICPMGACLETRSTSFFDDAPQNDTTVATVNLPVARWFNDTTKRLFHKHIKKQVFHHNQGILKLRGSTHGMGDQAAIPWILVSSTHLHLHKKTDMGSAGPRKWTCTCTREIQPHPSELESWRWKPTANL